MKCSQVRVIYVVKQRNGILIDARICIYHTELLNGEQVRFISKNKRPLEKKYEGVSKIFRTGAVKIIKLTIRPIGRHHHQSSSLPHVDTGTTVSSIFGTLPGSLFLSESQALSAIRPGSPQLY
jgi:hypothetical protein